jgi:nucleotide-binding universal stress UspA family protein
MIALKRILVPTDFSVCSDAALKYGRALTEAFGATLHLLHIVQDPYTQPWAAEAFPTPLGEMLAQWEDQARQRLATLLPDGDRKGAAIATVVGSPF